MLAMGPHATIATAQIDALLAVNVNGVVHCIDAALPLLLATPGAHIVTMSSTSAEYGTPDLAVYSASKFFVRGLTEALNIELAPRGVQVSDVVVAYVRTPMVQQAPVQARSVERLGVHATAEQVPRTVWRAAHGTCTHWRVGRDAVLLAWLVRWLGPWARGLVRRATGS
ncbi:SDR family NAD(P)-dependent oxidoreductase [Ideonella sp.]|uniref:SDR family NAD(P)-dependent oxidoreductase n=1 Tax=Ideonella sp. TaxID=1929293 RepID=UPI003BB59BAE